MLFGCLSAVSTIAQNAYQVSEQFDQLMARFGVAGGPAVQNADTRVISLLDADLTMRLDRVTLSNGKQTVNVSAGDPLAVVCPVGVGVCAPESAPIPSGETPLRLALFRRGIDPFPEFQQPAEYDYYPPTSARARGILVGRKPGLLWNTSLGIDGPTYASAATDTELSSAMQNLRQEPSVAR